jgi:hypothetical protein
VLFLSLSLSLIDVLDFRLACCSKTKWDNLLVFQRGVLALLLLIFLGRVCVAVVDGLVEFGADDGWILLKGGGEREREREFSVIP